MWYPSPHDVLMLALNIDGGIAAPFELIEQYKLFILSSDLDVTSNPMGLDLNRWFQ
jgi:hypothetical protein